VWFGGRGREYSSRHFQEVTYNASKVSSYLSDQGNEPKDGDEYNPNSSRDCIPVACPERLGIDAWDISSGVRGRATPGKPICCSWIRCLSLDAERADRQADGRPEALSESLKPVA